ncbi:MAG: acyl-CoA thioesterase [Bdellovibrionales bacterium]|nr:acyl-CoA thioesterase [Bdellovibrionales bacterium]
MNLYFRFFALLIRHIFPRPAQDPFSACTTHFRVSLGDLDLNMHMNNGRYLTLMDLGRFDLLLKARIFWKLLRLGYYPVVVSESIRFRKSLEPFQRFAIVTRMESWDDRDIFLHQRFVRADKTVAEGFLKARFKQRGRQGSVPTAELFKILGLAYTGPKLSPLALAQTQIESQLTAP